MFSLAAIILLGCRHPVGQERNEANFVMAHSKRGSQRKVSVARCRRLTLEVFENRLLMADLTVVTTEDHFIFTGLGNYDFNAVASVLAQPAHGSVQLLSTNKPFFTYTPAAGFYGTDSFVAGVVQNDGGSDDVDVTVLVRPNEGPLPFDTIGTGSSTIGAAGAVGTDSIVEMTNDSYTVRDKSGNVLTQTSLGGFWNSALGADSRVNEVQELRWEGALAPDPFDTNDYSFVISYGPLLSEPITYNYRDSALLQSGIQTALDGMFGAGNTRVLMMIPNGFIDQSVDVVFCGQLAGMPMQPLELRWAGDVIAFSDLQQSYGGSFTLSFAMPTGMVTTPPISFTKPSVFSNRDVVLGGVVQKALDATFGPGKAFAKGSHIEFADPELKVHPPTMTIDDSKFVGGHVFSGGLEDSTTSDEVQTVTFNGQPTGGSFTLTVGDFRQHPENGAGDSPFETPIITTLPIDFSTDARQTAANIQAALTAPGVLGANNAVVTPINGDQFDVRFDGSFTNTQSFGFYGYPVFSARLGGDASGLIGGDSPAITVTDANSTGVRQFGEVTLSEGAGNEVQRLSIQGSAAGGIVALAYNSDLIQGIAWSDDRATFLGRLQSALDKMFGGGNTKVFEVADGEFDIGFCGDLAGDLAGARLAPLYVLGTPDGVTAQIAEIHQGAGNEIQRLSIDGNVTGGDFTLSYGPLLAAKVPWSSDPLALAQNVQAGLSQMFGAGTARVLPAGMAPNEFDIIFGGSLAATKMMPLTVTSSLMGGQAASDEIAAGTGNAVQRITFSAASPGQIIKLALPHLPVVSVVWNSDPAQMQSSLQAELDKALGAGNSRVFVTADHQLDIVFCGQFGGLPMPPLALITDRQTQQISLDPNSQYSGTITLEIPWSTGTVATAPISITRPNSSTADAIVKALTDALAMPDVLVTCQATIRGFTITLEGPGAADIPPLTLDISQLSPSIADVAIMDSGDPSSGNVTVAVVADGKGATSSWLEIPANTPEGTPINIGLPQELQTNEYPSGLTPNPFYRTILYSSNQATLKSRVEAALNDLLGAGSVAVWDGPQSSSLAGPVASLLVVFTGDFANTYLAGPQVYFDAGGTFTFLQPSITGLNFNAVSPMLPQVSFDQQTGRWFATSTLVSPEQGDLPGQLKHHSTVVLAVSNSSDPRGGWKAITIDPDRYRLHDSGATSLVVGADTIQIAVQETDKDDGITPAAPSGVTLIAIPKSDLLGDDPTAVHAVVQPVTPAFVPPPSSGLYSATFPDPSDPYDSWTFKEYVPGSNVWALNIHKDSAPPTNRPVAVGDNYQTKQDTLLSISGAMGVLSNDQASQPGDLQATLVQMPAHGDVKLNADGSFVYTPAAGFSGSDTFTYLAKSGGAFSKLAGVTIDVLAVNAAPTFTSQGDVSVTAESGPQAIVWANRIASGPPNEIGQHVHFVISNSNPALFDKQPTIDAAGTLTFVSKWNTGGSAVISVALVDDGGTANGGIDTSSSQTFGIQVDLALPWHNPGTAPDVTGDGDVVAEDVVDVINYINAKGAGPVVVPGGAAGQSVAQAAGASGAMYYDVTGDDYVAADDVVAIINFINSHPKAEPEAIEAATQAMTADDALLLLLAGDAATQTGRRKV
ncbi:MAG TPA: Ig-like domain-containing protein [Pirellulaceae bacterium]|jgi:hypothetical protein